MKMILEDRAHFPLCHDMSKKKRLKSNKCGPPYERKKFRPTESRKNGIFNRKL